jgi:mRNA interferase MazF
MTNFQAGDLVLVAFPFTTGAQVKLRPALILLDSGDTDILVARVTTQPVSTAYDVTLTDWKQAGLLAPSTVRLHKLATLEKALVRRSLGRLEPGDRQQVATVLNSIFGAW